MPTRLLVFCVLLIGLIGCGPEMPPETRTAVQSAETYELLSLNPVDRANPPPGNFHGYQVLGRTTVTDPATRNKLNDALDRGIKANAPPAACFNPRHGVRITHRGQITEMVICFECHSAMVYRDGKQVTGFNTSQSPEPTFDAVLKAAGVPLAEK